MRKYLQLLIAMAFVCGLVTSSNAADSDATAILSKAGVSGGLIVHADCGDGALAIALARREGRLIHGLVKTDAQLNAAREAARKAGLTGEVSFSLWTGGALPFLDNQINLLIADGVDIAADEVDRALAPLGVAMVGPRKTVKPWPNEIDEWTHYLHGPSNNAVSNDSLVGPPRHIQWVAEPKWARHHNHLSGTSALVSSRGRLFSIIDYGPVASLAQDPVWRLVARDAFSGVKLWSREVGPWEGHLRRFRSGPTELPRRMVADGDRLYVTLGYHKPVTALDAATGEIVKTYDNTEDALEILVSAGVLYLSLGEIDEEAYVKALREAQASPAARNRSLRAINAKTGKTIWEKKDADTNEMQPTTLALADGRAIFHNLEGLICLDLKTGAEIWRAKRPAPTKRKAWASPTVVIHDGVLLMADRAASEQERGAKRASWEPTAKGTKGPESMGELIALSMKDGKPLWSTPCSLGYNSPSDIFVADDLVWVNTIPAVKIGAFTEGRDLKTGDVKRTLETDYAFSEAHHHRCYRNKATNEYIVLGRTGTAFIDLDGDDGLQNAWVRGACQYGVLPCNGLLYTPPHSCACYIQSKLTGFYALSATRNSGKAKTGERLVKGEAFGKVSSGSSSAGGWATYRGDIGRMGRADISGPSSLKQNWETSLKGRLTAPVAANGIVCLASIDQHTVHTLDASTGQEKWSFLAGGSVDSPPTLDGGRVYFGCADGWVYCLTQSDGALVWRYRAAPEDRHVVSFGELESVWPVTGNVLVRDGVVFCTAGRSSYLDDGMRFVRLDAATGKLIGERRIDFRDPETGEQPNDRRVDTELPGALPDVLACDGESLYLRDLRLEFDGEEKPIDGPHLYSPVGFLDDNWWHRTYWIYGYQTFGRASGWSVVARHLPSGRILSTDGESIFGYGRVTVVSSGLGMADVPMHLFKSDREVTPTNQKLTNNNPSVALRHQTSKVNYDWTRKSPIAVRAMVLTKDAIVAAGPLFDPSDPKAEPKFVSGEKSKLLIVDVNNGKDIASYNLAAQPVFDGLIATGAGVYMSTVDGTVQGWFGE